MIDVLIADDQNFVRKTLESYLELESDLKVVGFAENGEIAVKAVETLKPDVVLMDLEMPVMDGFAATKTIAEKFGKTKVLIVSIHDREEDVTRALKLGAKGYWLKNTTAKELADAIRRVHEGYFQLALQLVEKHFEQAQLPDSQFKHNLESNSKLDIVDTVLAKIEEKITFLKELTPQDLNETIENIVKQEMALRKEKETNLQFRLDRLKHRLHQTEKITSLAIKLQLVFNVISIAAVATLSYFIFTSS